MKKRTLGRQNAVTVSAIGLGCMGFSHGYGPGPDRGEAIRLIRTAYELGCTFFDTAESYAAGENETLVGEAIRPFRQQVILATKLHIPDGGNLEQTIRAHLEASLKRLGTDYVDLYYQHRVNKTIPVEEVAGVMGKLIGEGKIRGWGQSQATEEELRRAHAVTPITAIQSEYSMMERMFEKDVLPACRELGIGFVPFSPLGAGFLSGRYTSRDSYTGDECVITAVHGGLECADFASWSEELEIISVGPTIENPHSVSEYVEIDTVTKTCGAVATLINDIANGVTIAE